MREDWYRVHLNDYVVKVYDTEVADVDGKAVVTSDVSFGWSILQPFAYIKAVYTFDENGVDIKCKVKVGEKVELLPRFGIRLFLDKSFEDVSYFGYGPYESYIDKHQASFIGNFTDKVSQMYEDYVKPQENSSHCGCKQMSISDGSTIIKFVKDSGFSFNASEYTQEELAKKKHNFKLEKCEFNVLCVDYMMAGVGSNACGPKLAEKYRLPLPEFDAHFHMSIK